MVYKKSLLERLHAAPNALTCVQEAETLLRQYDERGNAQTYLMIRRFLRKADMLLERHELARIDASGEKQ